MYLKLCLIIVLAFFYYNSFTNEDDNNENDDGNQSEEQDVTKSENLKKLDVTQGKSKTRKKGDGELTDKKA